MLRATSRGRVCNGVDLYWWLCTHWVVWVHLPFSRSIRSRIDACKSVSGPFVWRSHNISHPFCILDTTGWLSQYVEILPPMIQKAWTRSVTMRRRSPVCPCNSARCDVLLCLVPSTGPLPTISTPLGADMIHAWDALSSISLTEPSLAPTARPSRIASANASVVASSGHSMWPTSRGSSLYNCWIVVDCGWAWRVVTRWWLCEIMYMLSRRFVISTTMASCKRWSSLNGMGSREYHVRECGW